MLCGGERVNVQLTLSCGKRVMLTDVQRAELDRDGFIVLRGLLSNEQVALWRDAWYALKADIAAGRSQVLRMARFVMGELPEPLCTRTRNGTDR
jgi:hypothetical protein